MVALVSVVAIVVATVAALRVMGRGWGERRLWTRDANSPRTSQRLADPYTLTHVLQGILLYGALSLGPLRSLGLGTRLVIATALESASEIAENTERVIQWYRARSTSDAYTGDSVVNSLGDMVAMMGGFFLAHALPVWASLLVYVGVEVALYATIRDNMTLAAIDFLAPPS